MLCLYSDSRNMVRKRNLIRTPLARWRRTKQLTQIQASAVLGMSQAHYSRLECGRLYPGRETAKRIAARTGLTLAVLLGAA